MNLGGKVAYACGTDWQHECGETNMELFENPRSLKKARPCWQQCGIVKLNIYLNEWIEGQDYSKDDDES